MFWRESFNLTLLLSSGLCSDCRNLITYHWETHSTCWSIAVDWSKPHKILLLCPQHQPFHNTVLLLHYHANRDHLLGILVLDGMTSQFPVSNTYKTTRLCHERSTERSSRMLVAPDLGRLGWHTLGNTSRQELPLWKTVQRDYCPYEHHWSNKAPQVMASVATHVPPSLPSEYTSMDSWNLDCKSSDGNLRKDKGGTIIQVLSQTKGEVKKAEGGTDIGHKRSTKKANSATVLKSCLME